jgi:hypothetical protein
VPILAADPARGDAKLQILRRSLPPERQVPPKRGFAATCPQNCHFVASEGRRAVPVGAAMLYSFAR